MRAPRRLRPWVPKPSQSEVLDVVRAFLTTDGDFALAVPELREIEQVFALAARDAGYDFESKVTSLEVIDLSGDVATVRAKRTLVPKGRNSAREQEQELMVHLVDLDGWKVRDLSVAGESLRARLQRLIVEPAAAEGISVRAWARSDPGGMMWIAINVRNDSGRHWRLKCAGFAWRKGPLWLLSQASSRALRRGGAVLYEPGAEHGIMLVAPTKAKRVWLRASPRRGLRSFYFALSWKPASVAAPADKPAGGFRKGAALIGYAAYALPFAAIAVFVSVVKSVPAAILVTSALAVVPLVEAHWCVHRLERKLARWRAESSA